MQQADKLIHVVGSLYEATTLPEMWPKAIAEIADLAGCSGGLIFALSRDGVKWVSSDEIAPLVDRFISDGWMERNERANGLIAHSATSFVTDHDVFTDSEISEMPVYRDFLRPLGYGWGTATHIRTVAGENMVISLERRYERGPVSTSEVAVLNHIRPHVARASQLAARLHLRKAEATLQVMATAGIAAALVDSRRQVVATNCGFETLQRQIVAGAFGRIALNDKRADLLFQAALANASQWHQAGPSSIAVPPSDDSPAFVLHIIPICRNARDLFAQANALLIVSSLESPLRIEASVLCELYDLTRAEASVAHSLLEGFSVSEIADRKGVARETVRGQVKSVLAKTGSRSQADFVRRLAPVAF